MSDKYVIGIDFGTDSVRAVVVNAQNGKIASTDVSYYSRWKEGKYCIPLASQFRQHPLDYLESMTTVLKNALNEAGDEIRKSVVGISVDTTGSTPVAVDQNGTPLALTEGFEENPNAMFILWKDHTGNKEAEEINELAGKSAVDFTKYEGGIYSSEWFWAKILRTLRVDKKVREKAFSWVEHCDWISAELTGLTDPLKMKRSRCAAGHKAMWHEDFEGLPSEEFLTGLDPLLSGLRDRLFSVTYTSDEPMGTISKQWAAKLGLNENVVIGVGAFDAHMGGVGAEIEPYSFVRVMGTSTCDMLVVPNDEMKGKLIPGICGQVDGSILPGMLGMEAGQSAYGDVYAWFTRVILEPVAELLGEEQAQNLRENLIPFLANEASELPLSENDPIALDWFNGRRTPDANHTLKGAIAGMNLGTTAPMIFKALVEATAFGSKAIVDRFLEQEVPIKQVIAIGGVAQKSSFVMQTLCDVLNMPIKIAASDQTCALGAAMCAATASGLFETIEDAQKTMGAGFDKEYHPDSEKHEIYLKLYRKYHDLGGFIEKEM
ncbi:MAG: ribulokinase [Cytophagales bacterium]|nr:ribulokinase [Cytophagales bacterium]